MLYTYTHTHTYLFIYLFVHLFIHLDTPLSGKTTHFLVLNKPTVWDRQELVDRVLEVMGLAAR
mgnify:CR=1 FL=1